MSSRTDVRDLQRRRSFLASLVEVTFVVALVGGLSACASTREASVDEEPDAPPVEEVDVSDYETFDPSDYPVPPPEPAGIEHDVPDVLMESRAGEGQAVTQQGFRIQVFSSLDREEAEVERARVGNLWDIQQREMWSEPGAILADAFPDAAPAAYLVYRQPYYRLRIGNFGSRAAAEAALAAVQNTYTGAFIVPATVTVER